MTCSQNDVMLQASHLLAVIEVVHITRRSILHGSPKNADALPFESLDLEISFSM